MLNIDNISPMRNMEISPDNNNNNLYVNEQVKSFWSKIGIFTKIMFLINVISYII